MEANEQEELLRRNQELQDRLDEAEETLRAIRSGEVDAVVVSGKGGEQVYTLKGADEAYRVMVQGMAEGALTLTLGGLILFANEQFASIVRSPLERVIGARIRDFTLPGDAGAVSALLSGKNGRKAEVRLKVNGAATVPVYLSVDNLVLDGAECVCVMVTDLSGQKRNEEIVAAEKLARSILEQAAEAIVVTDPEGRIIRASRAAERLAGTAVLQHRFDDVFCIADYAFQEVMAAARRGVAIQDLEVAAVTADGRKLDLLLSAAALTGHDSEVVGCVLDLSDITGRKGRERQLKFQADILENTSEAVIAIDQNRRVTYWNLGAARIYGLGEEDALGRRLADIYQCLWSSPDAGPQVDTSLEEPGMFSGESVHVRRDGNLVCVSAAVNAIAPEHGGGMFAVIRDITEKKKAEAVLKESEARERSRAAELQAIMEAVPAAVMIGHDAECRRITGNPMAYRLLRMPYGVNVSKSAPADEKSGTWHAMKDGKEVPAEELPMQMAARTGKAVDGGEFELVFDDGSSQFLLSHAVPLLDEAGRARGAVGTFIDITERKRVEELLRQTQKLEGIGRLAGGIAHDFNNLLVGVIGGASLAQEALPPEHPAADLLQGVMKTGEQLAYLTRQLLAYAGKGFFFTDHLDLSDLVPEMNELVRPSISKKIAVHFELAPGLPPIEADRGHMQQIYMNLVLNAAEAIGSNAGLISVRTGSLEADEGYIRQGSETAALSPGKYVYLEVRDTGCGMDADTKSKVFDPFFTTKFMGRGLGLAAVAGIVQRHKGAIKVTSVPGKGSCFTVLFPVVEGDAPPRPADKRPSHGTGTVVVVDDEAIVRETARMALTRHGFDVLLAESGLEAIDILKRHPGDIGLVVLDLSMPGMSGEETLPELRKIRPGVKVVISSGYGEEETMALFKGQAVSGFIQKPYTSGRLAEKVKATLG